MLRSVFLRLALFVCVLPASGWGQSEAVQAVVQDPTGAAIVSAEVRLSDAVGGQLIITTDEQGRFQFPKSMGIPAHVEIHAKGFKTLQRTINGPQATELVFTMTPSAQREDVTVSAARTEVRLSETPGSTILLSETDVISTPALRIDDVLRQVPGFSLFRRSGSRTANASAQGFSLRGLGGSAASRALVLLDGISLVDPFGAWVNWDRIPRVSLANVEVYRGGTSNLYGSAALGGVVQFRMREPDVPSLVIEGSFGNETTPDFSIWTGTRKGAWNVSSSAELFRTDGYILVPNDVRGAIDTAANSENASIYARVSRDLGTSGDIFVRGNFFTEFRNNGTPSQTNDTRLGEGALGLDQQFGAKDSLSLRIYGEAENYNQRFSAIAPDRDSEILTNIQHVPEQVIGGAGQWTRLLGNLQTLIVGSDLNEVIGSSRELLLTGLNRGRIGGGRQRTAGFFGEDIVRFRQWTVILAGRVDYWQNFKGELLTSPLSGPPELTQYPDRTESAFSPRVSVLRTINKHLSVTASAYRAFRAPSLNELYRTFRVGNVVTSNNAFLKAERLTGGEVGLNVSGLKDKLNLRANFFWSEIKDPIANVTVDSTSDPIQRIKENLGRTRSRGIEFDGVWKPNRDFQISAGYSYTEATVIAYPGNPGGVSLVGLNVPQVPRNVFTWEARYWNASRFLLSFQGRFIGQQFDDDQNTFPLDRFYSMDAQVGRGLGRHMQIFVAAENIFNQRYQVARTPVLNLGPPALVRVGLRFEYPGNQ
ncbi:MAG TPA: TonB-dependent receptor [Terriglobales bacterium]|jgi:outer membrane receptor protein involved in Fe transport|nr:TonB-dependent receptor [Terriglobales bacterium]